MSGIGLQEVADRAVDELLGARASASIMLAASIVDTNSPNVGRSVSSRTVRHCSRVSVGGWCSLVDLRTRPTEPQFACQP